MRSMFKSKIHRATITHADLEYEGSLSIDQDLMDAADILEFERVEVWNITRGSRLTTYAITAPRGSGIICANGAAAHLNHAGDLIIIATFQDMAQVPADYRPTVVQVDGQNRMVRQMEERGGPHPVEKSA